MNSSGPTDILVKDSSILEKENYCLPGLVCRVRWTKTEQLSCGLPRFYFLSTYVH